MTQLLQTNLYSCCPTTCTTPQTKTASLSKSVDEMRQTEQKLLKSVCASREYVASGSNRRRRSVPCRVGLKFAACDTVASLPLIIGTREETFTCLTSALFYPYLFHGFARPANRGRKTKVVLSLGF